MDDNTHRWSEVIPPHTALSFAALWDPEDGMVTFTGPALLNAAADGLTLRDMPLDAGEGRSQILTLDGLSLPFSSAVLDTAGLPRANRVQFSANALDEGQSILDPYMRYLEDRRRLAQRQATSEKARRRKQRIVHLDWSQLKSASGALATLGNRILRPFTIASNDYDEDDGGSFTYDGLFEEVPVTARTSTSAPMLVHLNLKSTFSMTTTSTTGYVDVETPSVYSQGESEAWSRIGEPHFGSYPNKPRDTRRRLRKPKPLRGSEVPARPDEVLARAEFNHAVSPVEPAHRPAETLVRGIRRLRSLPRVGSKARLSPTATTTTMASSVTAAVAAPPLPRRAPPTSFPLASFPLEAFPHPPGSPEPTPSAATSGRTLGRQRSMTQLVKEGVERLTRCHGRGKRDGWEHVAPVDACGRAV